mgnify:CR=1 FL=1
MSAVARSAQGTPLDGAPLAVEKVFSAEIEGFKQAYIQRNFPEGILFRDCTELGDDKAHTASGALVEVPGGLDLLVAGTSCVDYSNLNTKQKGIDQRGESGQTFWGMLGWVRRHRPRRSHRRRSRTPGRQFRIQTFLHTRG